jgi:hypothetical protein
MGENYKQFFADNLSEIDFFAGICNKEGELVGVFLNQ